MVQFRQVMLGGLLLGGLGGCFRSPRPAYVPPARPRSLSPAPTPPPKAVRLLPRMGYALQAGAFAQVENAARLAATLKAQGLDAAYYRSGDGLFRVRFGDFATRDQAKSKGMALKAAGVLEDYYVVAPDGSAPSAPGRPHLRPSDETGLRASLVETALGYQGIPYLFGGTTDKGFDCSGLTGAVYQLNGLRLPRNSMAQFDAGTPVSLEEARPGDLLFFATKTPGRVSHVGLYLGQGTFIHAPRTGRAIRKDDLQAPYYQAAFLGARSYL